MDTIQASTGQANKIHPFEQYYVIPVMFPVLTSSGKVLYQAFKTRRPYLRSQVYLKPSISAGSPKDLRAHNTPSVMSCSVVNDWDQICLPEETFLLGQSWEFMGPEWRCKSSKEKKKRDKEKASFFLWRNGNHLSKYHRMVTGISRLHCEGTLRHSKAARPCLKVHANALRKVSVVT